MGGVGPSFGGRIGSLRVPSESAPTGGSNRARRAGIRAEAQASALRRRLMNYFDVYISYSLWVGPHLSSHSYPGQPLGSAASKLCGPFPLEPCSISVRGGSRVLGKVLIYC